MNEEVLSKRLRAAADAVREGSRVADVGCDHGKLCAALVAEGRVPFATAIDISAPSLEKARILFEELGIEDRTKTVFANGLSETKSSEADDIVIAGVGPDTAAEIIGGCGWLKDESKRLILVPASHHERLRQYLYENGFKIEAEKAVCEKGKCYTVIIALFCGIKQKIMPQFAAVGLISRDGGDGDEYLDAILKREKRILLTPCKKEKKDAARAIAEYIEEELK